MSCKSWKALDPEMIPMFKSLLLRFNLAYPANREKPLETVDMIVPVYWKTREAAQALGRSFLRQQSVLARNLVVGASVAKWNYSLPIGIAEAIFVKFVVRSYTYRPNANRAVKDNYFECFVRGEFGAAISFITDEAKKCDDITIEVAAATTELAWSEMRYFVIAMEQILLQYPGLEADGTQNVKRCIVDLQGNVPGVSHDVNFLFAEDQSEEQLRRSSPWLPRDFKWFIERVEKRRFPAVWTISYPENSSEMELRMHSDLSGKCYHKPLLISNPNGFARFVADNADFIQVGISVLSVATATIPIAVVSAAVELVLSTSRDLVDGVSTVKSVLDRAHLDPSEAKASKDMAISPGARMGFLKKLLELHDPSFDESSVSDTADLRCATTNDGSYVWVHKSEMQKLHGYIMPCADISIDISYLEGFRTAGHTNLRRKVYCSWEITYGTTPQPIEFGFTEDALWTSDAGPLWASSAIKLKNVDTIEMLHECMLKVWVNQARQFTACFRGEKEIGRGEEELKNHVLSDQCSSTTIDIPISLSEIAPITSREFCVICQLKIEFPHP
ncbi:hypothetical protein PHYPSEUDO_000706 [Phytophthora pseudosyringae]|uniref:Uncharacterized protein n=1 Tax=Phytophthora pseudosyringae TaxID=221518 RepID=A0A8T1W0I2_9STRA|nr:hypothetical protein PHYPSEUDO_000706 [Phytophthora pseudosyringae]